MISGIGFLGAGVILKDGANIRGLNTAATLWSAAAIGCMAGAELFADAALVTVFVLTGNTALRPLVNWIDRRPLSPHGTDAQYRVHATCRLGALSDARDLLAAALDAARYPARRFDVAASGADHLELTAILMPNSAQPAELDRVVAELEASPLIDVATWSVGAIS